MGQKNVGATRHRGKWTGNEKGPAGRWGGGDRGRVFNKSTYGIVGHKGFLPGKCHKKKCA